MTDKLKSKIESAFEDIEERIEISKNMPSTDRRNELKKLDAAINDLENDINRLQMNYAKYAEACDAFEQRFAELTVKFKKANPDAGEDSANNDDEEAGGNMDATQRQIQETNMKLKEGKDRALAMLRTVNCMKEEMNLIDDEVMLQREKLLAVNEKLKDTQSVLNQTKKLVNFFSNAVYEDVIVKILIGLIAVAILVILGMAINIKMKKGNLAKQRQEKEEEFKSGSNYDEIDEVMFQNYAKNKMPTSIKEENNSKKLKIKKEKDIVAESPEPASSEEKAKAGNDEKLEDKSDQKVEDESVLKDEEKSAQKVEETSAQKVEDTSAQNNEEKSSQQDETSKTKEDDGKSDNGEGKATSEILRFQKKRALL